MEINQVLSYWDMSQETSKQIYPSAWQVGECYILKTGSDINALNNNLTLIRALSRQNIPVAGIVKTVNGADYVSIDNQYYFLSKRLSGEHISDIYSGNYLKLSYTFGKVIGRLHRAFLKCQGRIYCHDNNYYEEITGWVWDTFQNKNIQSIPQELLTETITALKEVYPKLTRQLIHRDIHPGNMLFCRNKLTGYIDFDLSQINARIFDLCYMALSLLKGHIYDSDKTAKWFEILKRLAEGYETIHPLTEEEKNAFPVIMLSIEMLFVAYYTNQNKAEPAAEAAAMFMWLWENRERVRLLS